MRDWSEDKRWGAGLMAVACLMGSLMAWQPITSWLRAMTWRQTEAILREARLEVQRDEDGNRRHKVTARYEYLYEGVEYTGTEVLLPTRAWLDQRDSLKHQQLRRQHGVSCYVNPAQPGEAVLDRSLRYEDLVMVLAFCGVFFGGGWTLFWRDGLSSSSFATMGRREQWGLGLVFAGFNTVPWLTFFGKKDPSLFWVLSGLGMGAITALVVREWFKASEQGIVLLDRFKSSLPASSPRESVAKKPKAPRTFDELLADEGIRWGITPSGAVRYAAPAGRNRWYATKVSIAAAICWAVFAAITYVVIDEGGWGGFVIYAAMIAALWIFALILLLLPLLAIDGWMHCEELLVEPDRWTARLGWWGLPKWRVELLTVNIDGVATQDAAAVAVHSGTRDPDEGTLDIAVNYRGRSKPVIVLRQLRNRRAAKALADALRELIREPEAA